MTKTSSDRVALSVVMPTRDRLKDVKLCLPTLRAQDLSGVEWEVIIVDNGSTDGTAEWAQGQVGGSSPRVRYVLEPNPGLLSGRHRGAAVAEGDLLTFIDDDIKAAPGWLRAIYNCFLEDPQVAMVGGPCLPEYEIEPPLWLSEFWHPTAHGGHTCAYLSLIYITNQRLVIDPCYIYGLNFSIRKTVLRELGGFHPDGVPEALLRYRGDGESGLAILAKSKGLVSVYHPEAMVLHKVPASRMTLEYFDKRAYGQGVSDSYTALRRQHGLYTRPKPSLVRGIRRRLGIANQLIATYLLGNSTQAEAAPMSEPRRRVQAAYQRGFAFHQKAMQVDPAVREWVLRPSYWDYKIPGF